MDRLNCGFIELKFAPSEDAVGVMSFTGYGAVFGNIDAGGDLIEPGAFAAFIADVKAGRQPWPALMSQHGGVGMTAQDLMPIGIITDLSEDGIGLKIDSIIADTPRGIENYKLMRMEPRPAIDGLSIGYIAKEVVPRSSPDEPRRRLKRIDLIEISLVTRPMNGKARVTGVKSLEEIETLADAERHLRDSCGLSKSEAVAFVSRVKCLGQSDSDGGEMQQLAEALKRRGKILAA